MKWVVSVKCQSSRGFQELPLRCTSECCSIHWWRWSWAPWCISPPWLHRGRAGCSSSRTKPHESLLKISSAENISFWRHSQSYTHAHASQLCSKLLFSVLFLGFDSFKCFVLFFSVSLSALTFLSHSFAGQTDLARRTLQGESDTVQGWDGGEHTGVAEERNWRTDMLVRTIQQKQRSCSSVMWCDAGDLHSVSINEIRLKI